MHHIGIKSDGFADWHNFQLHSCQQSISELLLAAITSLVQYADAAAPKKKKGKKKNANEHQIPLWKRPSGPTAFF